MQKDTTEDQSLGCWRNPFSPALKTDKSVENLRKQNGTDNGSYIYIVCSRDVEQMNIGSLADESG